MVRLQKHRHKGVLFEQEQLRLPNGRFPHDAPERLHKFWLQHGLYVLFEPHEQDPNMLLVKSMWCTEDVL